MSGLQARPATIAYGTHQEGVAIELSPLGARTLFGMPSRVLWDARSSARMSSVAKGQLTLRASGVADRAVRG